MSQNTDQSPDTTDKRINAFNRSTMDGIRLFSFMIGVIQILAAIYTAIRMINIVWYANPAMAVDIKYLVPAMVLLSFGGDYLIAHALKER